MELSKSSKALISINLVQRGSFSLLDILNAQKIPNYKVKDMAQAAYSTFSSIIIVGKS